MTQVTNNSMNKIRVAVLAGGRSAEHEVSLRSAKNVIQNLDSSRFEVVPITIDKQGSWFLGEDVANGQSIDLIQHIQGSERLFDVIFPAIHGTFCEDGTVQGLLELADIPYVGCGVLASAIGMDKDVAKRLVTQAGFRVPPYLVVKQGQWYKNSEEFCALVDAQLTYPLFVKPANAGSSIGIAKVKQPQDLSAAIKNAFLYDTKVLVEQGIDAIELELSVLESREEGADPIVSMAGEIKPSHEFYSYAAKYLDEHGAELIIPAPISSTLQTEAQWVAKNIFNILECEGMARVDLFLDKKTNHIYFNEINTLPGFTQISMYPKLMMASGMNYQDLLTQLVELALDRYARKVQIARMYLAEEGATSAA
jgi:D-alanine-D-alanine ligase